MFPLVETIRYENGKFHNLELHEARCNRSRSELFPHIEPIQFDTKTITTIEPHPNLCYKVRVLYREQVEEVQWHEYAPASIKSLKLVECNTIDYHLKSTDRSVIDELNLQRGKCDSIIIVKNGMITDSAYANLLFFDDEQWFTPSTPLLAGVMREQLLRDGIVVEKDITVNDIVRYHSCKLINAMIPFESTTIIPITEIH